MVPLPHTRHAIAGPRTRLLPHSQAAGARVARLVFQGGPRGAVFCLLLPAWDIPAVLGGAPAQEPGVALPQAAPGVAFGT